MGTGSTDHTATVKKREAGLAPLWYAQRRVLRHALHIASDYLQGVSCLHALISQVCPRSPVMRNYFVPVHLCLVFTLPLPDTPSRVVMPLAVTG